MIKDVRENKMVTGPNSNKAEGKPSADKKGDVVRGKKSAPSER